MARCVRCGKRGLFLKLNPEFLCQNCVAEIKAREAEEKRQQEERERLERERIREERARAARELKARQIRFTVPISEAEQYLLIKHASKNPNYSMKRQDIIDCSMTDERIFKYYFKDVEVEIAQEKDNKRAPDMQRVLINGDVIGNVPKAQRGSVAKALDAGNVESITAILTGGPSKIVREYLNEDTFVSRYSMFNDDYALGCDILITKKQ